MGWLEEIKSKKSSVVILASVDLCTKTGLRSLDVFKQGLKVQAVQDLSQRL